MAVLIQCVIAGYRDLVELKRPDMDVLNWDSAHRNYYFAAEVSKAIGQYPHESEAYYIKIIHLNDIFLAAIMQKIALNWRNKSFWSKMI